MPLAPFTRYGRNPLRKLVVCSRVTWPSRTASPFRGRTSVTTVGPGSSVTRPSVRAARYSESSPLGDADGPDVCAGCAGKSPPLPVEGAAGRTIHTALDAHPARSTSVLSGILTDPRSGQIHTKLVPLFDALIKADSPAKCHLLAPTASRRRSSATRRHGPRRGRSTTSLRGARPEQELSLFARPARRRWCPGSL